MSIRSIVPTARSGSTGKVVSAREAVRLIRVGDTVAIGGFFAIGLAVEVIHELAAVFEATDEETLGFGKPRDLTLMFCASPGDRLSGGANRLAQRGLVKRVIGGHWTGVPALYQLVAGNQVEGYNMPLGPMSHLYRDIAAGKPGHLSRVGLGTFADPRFGGGKLNEMTTEDLVELVEIGGEEYLFYKAFPVNVAIVRGTTADPAGNITMEREALTCDTLSLAMAAHNSGGLVIAQVERLAEVNSLNPRQVKIPGALVDCMVVATDPGNHPQTLASPYSPAFAAEVRVPLTSLAPMPMSDRKIIARRAAMELRPNSVVNLGYGIPEGVASVAAEEKIAGLMTLTAEPGVIGGIPAGGDDFGAATNPQAVIDLPERKDRSSAILPVTRRRHDERRYFLHQRAAQNDKDLPECRVVANDHLGPRRLEKCGGRGSGNPDRVCAQRVVAPMLSTRPSRPSVPDDCGWPRSLSPGTSTRRSGRVTLPSIAPDGRAWP